MLLSTTAALLSLHAGRLILSGGAQTLGDSVVQSSPTWRPGFRGKNRHPHPHMAPTSHGLGVVSPTCLHGAAAPVSQSATVRGAETNWRRRQGLVWCGGSDVRAPVTAGLSGWLLAVI